MEELVELKKHLLEDRPVPWEDLPDIALYMDQITSYMPRQFIHFGEGEVLTSAMVNNYIKDGLLPRADGKRYSPTHLAYLTGICALKRVLSVKEAKILISDAERGRDMEKLYHYFCSALDVALSDTAQRLDENTDEEHLSRLAMDLALRSYADQLACQQVLSILQTRQAATEEKPEKAKEKKKKTATSEQE